MLLSGDYAPLLPAFTRIHVDQFVLEYSTPRAGDVDVVGQALRHKELGLGVVNPRTSEIESVEQITQQVELALRYYRPEQIFLNPDCGFGTFASRCVNDHSTAAAKLHQMAAAADILRSRYA